MTKQTLNNNEDINLNELLELFLSNLLSLNKLLEKENKLLQSKGKHNFNKLVTQKEAIANKLKVIEEQVKLSIIKYEEDKYSNIIQRIKDESLKLKDITERNDILLKTHIEVSTRIVDLYKKKQIESTINNFGYNKEGTISASKKLEKIMPSINLNSKV